MLGARLVLWGPSSQDKIPVLIPLQYDLIQIASYFYLFGGKYVA